MFRMKMMSNRRFVPTNFIFILFIFPSFLLNIILFSSS